jgi:DNA-binding transcriptional MerR regulator
MSVAKRRTSGKLEGRNKGTILGKKGKLVPIGTAAKKAGVSRQSLQYYLMIGLLEATEVTSTGRRLFDEEDIKRIKLIKRLNESGYQLRAIRELFLQGHADLKGNEQ